MNFSIVRVFPVPRSLTSSRLMQAAITLSTILLITLICAPVVAQDAGRTQQNLNTSDIRSGNITVTFNESYYGIDGSPYSNPEFLPGSFYQLGAGRFGDARLRYNAYEDWLEIILEGDSLVLSPVAIRSFEISEPGSQVHFRNGYVSHSDGITRQNYFQVLHDGEILLLRRISKQLREANFDPVFQTGSRYDRFEEQERFYTAKRGDTNVEQLRLRRRDVLGLMGDKSDQVGRYARENRLNFRSADDVVKMLLYYEQKSSGD